MPHSQAAKEAIPYKCKQKRKCPTPIRRRLKWTHAVLGRVIPRGCVPMSGIKVRSLQISITDRPTKCSGKDSAEKHLILLDLSKTKMVSCSEMRTFLAAGESISKIFWTRSLSDHRTYRRIHLWEEKYRYSRGRISCQNTEGRESCRLRWNPTWNTHSFEQAKDLQRFKWNRVLERHRKIRKLAWSFQWMDRCCLNLLNRALHLIGFQVHSTKWE